MVEKQWSYVTLFLKFYLISIGEGLKKYGNLVYYFYSLFVGISYALTFLSMTLFIIHTNDRILRIESLGLMLALLMTLVLGWIISLNKNVVFEIIKVLNESDDNFIKSSNQTFLLLLKNIILLMIFCEISYFLCPIVMLVNGDVKICDPDTFYILCELPWQCDSPKMYMVTMGCHLVMVIHPIIRFYSTSLAISSIYAFSFTKFSNSLTSIEGYLVRDHTNNQGEKMNEYLDNLLCNRFIEFVKYYQLYIRSTIKIAKMLSAVSNVILIGVTIILIGDMSVFTEFQVPILKKMRCLCTTTVMLIQLSVTCYVGEHIKEANAEIRNAVYNIPWYEQSIKLRKIITMFMTQTHYSNTIKVYGVYPLNINFSVTVFKNVYSGLNIYLSSYKNTE